MGSRGEYHCGGGVGDGLVEVVPVGWVCGTSINGSKLAGRVSGGSWAVLTLISDDSGSMVMGINEVLWCCS